MSISGSGCELVFNDQVARPLEEIERSIIKKFRKQIWKNFITALKNYQLVEEGDKVAVCISGGKDSLLMAKLFQELQRHGQVKFELAFIAMDPGFNEANRVQLLKNCEHLNIPIQIFDSGIFEVVDRVAADYPCYLCARMRRGFLYKMARSLGCNKMALGHHFNDVIETTMLNVLYAGNFKTMLPKLRSTNFHEIELIRPMYHIHEDDIKKFAHYSGLNFMNCGCIVAAQKTSSKRREIKELIKSLKLNFADVEKSIFQSANNVNLNAVLGYQQGQTKHFYLDHYGTNEEDE
jgi:tRNA(Ile)-lysidine synthase TilS/MesJ